MRHIGFEHLRVSAFESHPGVLGLVPELFDTVEFGAVGGQKVKRQALLFKQIDEEADAFGGVDRGVVEDDGQRFGDVLLSSPRKPTERSEVAVCQSLALKRPPLESRAASTLSCLPRLASIRWRSPQDVQALRLG